MVVGLNVIARDVAAVGSAPRCHDRNEYSRFFRIEFGITQAPLAEKIGVKRRRLFPSMLGIGQLRLGSHWLVRLCKPT